MRANTPQSSGTRRPVAPASRSIIALAFACERNPAFTRPCRPPSALPLAYLSFLSILGGRLDSGATYCCTRADTRCPRLPYYLPHRNPHSRLHPARLRPTGSTTRCTRLARPTLHVAYRALIHGPSRKHSWHLMMILVSFEAAAKAGFSQAYTETPLRMANPTRDGPSPRCRSRERPAFPQPIQEAHLPYQRSLFARPLPQTLLHRQSQSQRQSQS